MSIFCRQCEQASRGIGCEKIGVCGKDEKTAVLQDLLVYALSGIAVYGEKAMEYGIRDPEVKRFMIEGLVTTVTNVNFDPDRIAELIKKSAPVMEKIKKAFIREYAKEKGRDFTEELPVAAEWMPADNVELLVEQAQKLVGFENVDLNDDIKSLKELLLYGLKGMAAYAEHALLLGYEDQEVNDFFYKGLVCMAIDNLSADDLTHMSFELGRVNLKCMELLDRAHTSTFGHPRPTPVFKGIRKGPAIIVSGHDLLDISQLLEQTADKGINVYTHGEMLPAHGYPELKKFSHLVGHFGTAWQNQKKEFDGIPAAILMTTNCIQEPKKTYNDRIFTSGLVAWPGVSHVGDPDNGKKDFSAVIEKALELGGFPEDKPGGEITIGFGHNAVLSVADKIVDAVKSGAIKHFFLIGGCDGAKPGRNYYTEISQKLPKDCVILTLGCGKFRINDFEFGDIGGIPRLLDCGQCNDAYSAIVIASALADAFKCGLNDLPLSIILSWYEQKAVCILLSLLSLGIKDIRIGPSLPAFISTNVLNILVEKFNLQPIKTPDEDIRAILGASECVAG